MATKIDPQLLAKNVLTDFADFLAGTKSWQELGNPSLYQQLLENATGENIHDLMKQFNDPKNQHYNADAAGLTTEQQSNTARLYMLQDFIGNLGTEAQQTVAPEVKKSLTAARDALSIALQHGYNQGNLTANTYTGNQSKGPTATSGDPNAPVPPGGKLTMANGQTVSTDGMTPTQISALVASGNVTGATGLPPEMQTSLDKIFKKYGNGSSKGLTPQQIANNAAQLNALVSSYGMDATNSNVAALVDQAAQHGWNGDRFNAELYKTPEFQAAFPGIFNDNGSLKMTPGQYIQQTKQYTDIAAQAGINLNGAQTSWLFRNDVSPGEFQARASADAQLRQNPELYKAFGQELMNAGIQDKPPTKSQLLEFVMGQGNNQWRSLWDNAAARYGSEQAGLQIGKGADRYAKITEADVHAAAAKGLTPDEAAKAFHDVATQMIQTLPFSRIQKAGLTHKDFVTATFGGKGSVEAQQKILKVAQSERVFEQSPGAGAGSQQTQNGRLIQPGATANADVATI
jgi:hypothetical protein